MPFTQETFATVGSQAANTPRVFSYSTQDDLEEVTGFSYFIAKMNQLSDGDVISSLIQGQFHILIVNADRMSASVQPLEDSVSKLVESLLVEIEQLNDNNIQRILAINQGAMLGQLCLLNKRFEEAFETGIEETDE